MKKFIKLFSLVFALCLAVTAFGCNLGADHKTPTDDKYFEYVLLADDTYAISLNEANKATLPKEIILPTTYASKPITKIALGAFKNTAITKISIPSGYKVIEGLAFENCQKLKTIEWADTLTTISHGAFSGCTGLVNTLYLPQSLTSIEALAFAGCANLLVVDLPSGCTVASNAFSANVTINRV